MKDSLLLFTLWKHSVHCVFNLCFRNCSYLSQVIGILKTRSNPHCRHAQQAACADCALSIHRAVNIVSSKVKPSVRSAIPPPQSESCDVLQQKLSQQTVPPPSTHRTPACNWWNAMSISAMTIQPHAAAGENPSLCWRLSRTPALGWFYTFFRGLQN